MKRFILFVALLLAALSGRSQLMQYGQSNTHYVDRNVTGAKWYTATSGSIIFGSTGYYRIQIEAYSGGLPLDYIQVSINNVKVSQLHASNYSTVGGTFYYSNSGVSMDVETRFTGNQPACTGGYYRLKLYRLGSGQIVDQMDVFFTTYSPSVVTIDDPAYVSDHKGQIDFQKVTATQTININPGVTIEPGGLFWPTGATEREFTIGACLNKTDGAYNDEYLADDGLSSQGLTVYPNPSTGLVNLSFEELSNLNSSLAVEVYSLQGKLVFSQEMDASFGGTSIDLSDQPKGMYMLEATIGGVVHHQPLVIQ